MSPLRLLLSRYRAAPLRPLLSRCPATPLSHNLYRGRAMSSNPESKEDWTDVVARGWRAGAIRGIHQGLIAVFVMYFVYGTYVGVKWTKGLVEEEKKKRENH